MQTKTKSNVHLFTVLHAALISRKSSGRRAMSLTDSWIISLSISTIFSQVSTSSSRLRFITLTLDTSESGYSYAPHLCWRFHDPTCPWARRAGRSVRMSPRRHRSSQLTAWETQHRTQVSGSSLLANGNVRQGAALDGAAVIIFSGNRRHRGVASQRLRSSYATGQMLPFT